MFKGLKKTIYVAVGLMTAVHITQVLKPRYKLIENTKKLPEFTTNNNQLEKIQ